ncbi:MAG: ABC transporter permease [Saprospiraceae bacterium]|nr:ABC transporter permease [Saprospiraceae bacterium]MBK6566927.1 ABC transporter permease [Saprospiraceae bacterium]MBK8852543.1 ABC transporter permease [Saprospiraceae bacterium]MBP6694781.1 ABC transporter permease [Saprospiraceae bacterium]
MRWKYIVKRLMLLFPTLCMVCFIAFTLRNLVPGDSAESYLFSQGSLISDPMAKKVEYEKIYKRLYLDKPVFYFSVLPHYYPVNIHAFTDPELRFLIKSLLKKGYGIEDILEYNETANRFLQQWQVMEFSEREKWISAFSFREDPEKIRRFISGRPEAKQLNTGQFLTFLEKMEKNKSNFFWPKFYWHGAENQFHKYITGVINLDFGLSSKDGKSVISKMGNAMKWTFSLLMFSLFLLFLISIPLGLFSGRYEGGLLDRYTEKISVVLYAIPVFWLASMLIIFCTSDQYSKFLHIFPSVGLWYDQSQSGFFSVLFQHSKQLILPVLCLTLNDFAFLIKWIKTNTIEQKNKPYIKLAIAKGLTDQNILFRHILPNVGVNIVAVLIGIIPSAFAGSLLIEVIFNIPGMGRLLYNSIFAADWNVVFGILLFMSFITVIINVAGDILLARINPKIHYHD